MIALCGTFRYAGVVPADGLGASRWTLEDASGASAPLRGDRTIDNRLVGLQPAIEISNGQLVLTASGRERAEVRSAWWQIDPALVDAFRGGDVLHLVRTGTGDIGVSLIRAQQLVLAYGAATAAPMGDSISVRSGPGRPPPAKAFVRGKTDFRRPESPGRSWEEFIRKDTWVEIALAGDVSRLRKGEKISNGSYSITVLRTFQDGAPGSYECLAISLGGTCDHAAVVSSAERLIKGELALKDWPELVELWPTLGRSELLERLSKAQRPWWKVW